MINQFPVKDTVAQDLNSIPPEKDVRFVNLTRETIRLGNPAVEIPPSGELAKIVFERRITERYRLPGTVIPVFEVRGRGEVMGLPNPQGGIIYIVPALLRNYLTSIGVIREDVVSPWAQGMKGGKRWASALAR
jgi:hypothetical protein